MKNPGKKLYHSTVRLEGEKVIYVDPWQIAGAPHDADVILITHEHHDHYSPEDIAKISKETTILAAPASIADQMPVGTISVEPGKSYTIAGIRVDTVAAYNIGRPFHPKEREYVGYIVTVDALRCFVAGDTDCIPENKTVACDVAYVPCGGKYTMDAKQAAELVNAIRPKIAVPIHYGTVTDSADAAEVFKSAVDAAIIVEIQE